MGKDQDLEINSYTYSKLFDKATKKYQWGNENFFN